MEDFLKKETKAYISFPNNQFFSIERTQFLIRLRKCDVFASWKSVI